MRKNGLRRSPEGRTCLTHPPKTESRLRNNEACSPKIRTTLVHLAYIFNFHVLLRQACHSEAHSGQLQSPLHCHLISIASFVLKHALFTFTTTNGLLPHRQPEDAPAVQAHRRYYLVKASPALSFLLLHLALYLSFLPTQQTGSHSLGIHHTKHR